MGVDVVFCCHPKSRALKRDWRLAPPALALLPVRWFCPVNLAKPWAAWTYCLVVVCWSRFVVGLWCGWVPRKVFVVMLKHGLELSDEGLPVGRDPRKMTHDELIALGRDPLSPMKVIRARCLDCCGGSQQEVRFCVAVDCPAWAYRMGKNPFRAEMSDERKAEAAARLVATRAALRSDDATSAKALKTGE